ncbi:DUF6719 family protein [Bradyrhizobium ivorense]|uniref:DUF6719 family protein n=1 Tax=Bradyrhizobium ivorense TaxID=2511166 RepID=UPI0010B8DBBC|nr:DUF6719 family protein [Bradyrhizobium ivorense]VIO75174.1 hypothetical protein CI41S_46790 [Bradyrhizobium ivorense]
MPAPRNVQYPVIAALALFVTSAPASAQHAVMREADIVDLRVGQRVLVDDGSCPAGQIKQVVGAKLSQIGVERARSCVPRLAKK